MSEIVHRFINQGEACIKNKNYPEAATKFRLALGFKPDPETEALAHARLGTALLLQKDYAKAEIEYLKSTALGQYTSAYAWIGMAQMWDDQGIRYSDSLNACEKAIQCAKPYAWQDWSDQLVSDANKLRLNLLSKGPGPDEALGKLQKKWNSSSVVLQSQLREAQALKKVLDRKSAEALDASSRRGELMKGATKSFEKLILEREQIYEAEIELIASDDAKKQSNRKLFQQKEALFLRLRTFGEGVRQAAKCEDEIAAAFSDAWQLSDGFRKPLDDLKEMESFVGPMVAEARQNLGRLPSASSLHQEAMILIAKLEAFAKQVATLIEAFGGDIGNRLFPNRVSLPELDRFSDKQIESILREQKTVDEICGEHHITRGTLIGWQASYSGKNLAEIGKARKAVKPAPATMLDRKVELELHILEPMRTTGLAFVEELEQRLTVIESDIDLFSKLVKNGANYASQLEELEHHHQTLLETIDEADDILSALGPVDTARLDAIAIKKIWDERIVPAVIREQARLLRATRPLGPGVDAKEITGENCEGKANLALLNFAFRLNKEINGNPLYSELWRWVTCDKMKGAAIWLYHHHTSEKWKCLYFKIGIKRILDNVVFSLESHVSFALGSDPTPYKIQESKAYFRDLPGWCITTESSKTFSTSSTVSVQNTFTESKALSKGKTVTDQQGTNRGRSKSHSSNKSRGGSQSDSWSNCASFSLPKNSAGYSFTVGGGDSFSWGNTESVTEGDSAGESYSRSDAAQASITRTTAESATAGFSSTDGTSVQTTIVAYGPDFSLPEKELLAKWQNWNADSAEVFRYVQNLFEAMCRTEIEHLRSAAKGRGNSPDENLDSCLEKIAGFMQVIYTKAGSDIKVAAVPATRPIAAHR